MPTMLYGSRAEEPPEITTPYCPECLNYDVWTPVNQEGDLCDRHRDEQSLYDEAERLNVFDEDGHV